MIPDNEKPTEVAPFGAILGIATGNVPVYSCDYDTVDETLMPHRHDYLSFEDGILMGYKWQCVEFARRWCYINCGYIFQDVPMAYDIMSLTYVTSIKDQKKLPLYAFSNGSVRAPEPGALLVWREGGEFERTGHVAIVSEVLADRIRIFEQNVSNTVWEAGSPFSRELPLKITDTGECWINCTFADTDILGWVIQTSHSKDSLSSHPLDARLLQPCLRPIPPSKQDTTGWLNEKNPDENAYIKATGGRFFTQDESLQNKVVSISEAAKDEIERATNELHMMFMHATDFVLRNDEVLERFNLPKSIWPRIRKSWLNRKDHMITGRFDFCLSEKGLKVYEYNADSASCYLETGKLQGQWARHHNYHVGTDAGARLTQDLIHAWRCAGVSGVLHMMQDHDLEETYHALYMKSAIEQAGIACKIINGIEELRWCDKNSIVDADGIPIRWVWKTWAWETALDQIRQECEEDDEKLKHYQFDQKKYATPRLVDVLLRDNVLVFEPLWTLIPSNKAILPVLWDLFPNNRYLLCAENEVTPQLIQSGYVKKPIVGRCGENISVVDSNSGIVAETSGKFSHHNDIYQALMPLPRLQGHNVQVCSFSVQGKYSACCVRVDESSIIQSKSDILPLRVLKNSMHLSGVIVGVPT